MKNLILLLTILAACQSKTHDTKVDASDLVTLATSQSNIELEWEIDSIFLFQSEKSLRIELIEPKYATIDNELIFSYIKPRAIHSQVDSFKIADGVMAKLLCTDFEEMNLDGTLRLAFLGTFNSKNEQIDLLRIGKIEGASDYLATEFAHVTNKSVTKEIRFLGVELDSSWIETYSIQKNGKITKN